MLLGMATAWMEWLVDSGECGVDGKVSFISENLVKIKT